MDETDILRSGHQMFSRKLPRRWQTCQTSIIQHTARKCPHKAQWALAKDQTSLKLVTYWVTNISIRCPYTICWFKRTQNKYKALQNESHPSLFLWWWCFFLYLFSLSLLLCESRLCLFLFSILSSRLTSLSQGERSLICLIW